MYNCTCILYEVLFLAFIPAKLFLSYRRLIFCFSKMKTDFWENHLKDFLVETAEMYYSVLNSKQPKYAAITELEGIYGVFQEVRI